MKRARKAISILVTLAMLIGLLLPAGAPALAATSNDVVGKKTVDKDFKGVIGTLQITEDSAIPSDFQEGESFVVTLPSGAEFIQNDPAGTTVVSGTYATDAANNILSISLNGGAAIDQAAAAAYVDASFSNKRTLNVRFVTGSGLNTAGKTTLNLAFRVKFDGFTGDLNANINPLDSGITGGDIMMGRVVGGGETINEVLSVENIGDGGTEKAGIIRITEGSAGNFTTTSYITLTLNDGFKWVDAGPKKTEMVLLGGLAGKTGVGYAKNVKGDEIKITFGAGFTPSTTRGIIELTPVIDVDSDADFGDVEVDVDGEDVTTGTLVVAKYADYGVKVEAASVEEVLAGKAEQELGKLVVEENIPGTLIDGRKVTIELPDWAKFDANPELSAKAGDTVFSGNATRDTENYSKATFTINRGGATPAKATKFEIKFKKVTTKAGKTGDLVVKLSSSAGIEEQEYVVAKVSAPVTATTTAKEIKLGVQDQAMGDIVITEIKKDTISDNPKNGKAAELLLELPSGGGFKWAKTPKAEVTEGNLKIGSVSKTDQVVTIKIDNNSTKPSAIKVTGLVVTVDRTVPVGAVEVSVKGGAVVENHKTGAADNEVFFDSSSAVKVFPANVVNPAPVAGSVTFNIGSSVYTENGVAKVMDASPYIKNGRTYVPVRYLALALGVTPENIIYENGVVTLKKGDVTLKLTIGDKNLDNNGTVSAMDVAPEVNNGRTMLPARAVAEGFGAAVGYANGTVVISY